MCLGNLLTLKRTFMVLIDRNGFLFASIASSRRVTVTGTIVSPSVVGVSGRVMVSSPRQKSLQYLHQIWFQLSVGLYVVKVVPARKIYPLDHAEQWVPEVSVALLAAVVSFPLPMRKCS